LQTTLITHTSFIQHTAMPTNSGNRQTQKPAIANKTN